MTANKCPVCDGLLLHGFLQRAQVPVHQNLVVQQQDAARGVTRGELDMVVCESCGFVFNRAFDLAKLSYGEDYDNSQSCSVYFDTYLDGLVKDLVENQGVRDSTVVEVGCGKGQFLRKLVAYPGAGNRGFGFDPSYIGPDSDLDGRLSFRPCYYDDSCTDVAADFVVCRHVIEHVPDPLQLLRSVRSALRSASQARVFFETPCVEWILRNRVVWDFFYEHCSLFSAASLAKSFECCGFQVDRVDHVFGGQYLWLEARLATADSQNTAVESDVGHTIALARRYGAEESALRLRWLTQLQQLRSQGKLALWGAGAKGATFANLVDPACTVLDCVVDVNPNKQGRFIPGTGHAIVAPRDLPGRGIRSAILMNPNYRNENMKLLADAGIEIDLIDWSDA
ncbi:class I SAM-dependent methyltransferase [soil metagenome]